MKKNDLRYLERVLIFPYLRRLFNYLSNRTLVSFLDPDFGLIRIRLVSLLRPSSSVLNVTFLLAKTSIHRGGE